MEEGATFNNTCEIVWDTEKEDLIPPKSTENEEGSKWAAFVDSVFVLWNVRIWQAVDQETTEADDPRFVTDSSVLVSESRTRKRNEQRGGRFQREKKERRIQKEREEPKEGETSLSVDQAAYTNVKLDISLMDVGNQRRTETNKSIELKHTASISREEECYVVIMGRCSSLDGFGRSRRQRRKIPSISHRFVEFQVVQFCVTQFSLVCFESKLCGILVRTAIEGDWIENERGYRVTVFDRCQTNGESHPTVSDSVGSCLSVINV